MPSATLTRVGLAHGDDRRSNVYRALDLVRADLEPKIRPQVLVKPNFLSSTNQLASSHADALRGVLDFLASAVTPPEEVIVAEGANEKYSGEAFDNFGYRAVAEASPIPVRLVDLHQEQAWVETGIVLADGAETSVRMPRLVLECPCRISLAIAKTHDACVVTLALKNMIMGTLYKADRIKMHGYTSHAGRMLPEEAQVLNVNLIRLARHLAPEIAVIDGTQGLQGNGPGGADSVDLRIAAAGADVFATDAIVAEAMGFSALDLGLLRYGHDLGLGIADPAQIEVVDASLDQVRMHFKPHDTVAKQMQWQAPPALQAYLKA
jgi:uncharacterized protein (DUF362 family)